jgi:hypothetical protein
MKMAAPPLMGLNEPEPTEGRQRRRLDEAALSLGVEPVAVAAKYWYGAVVPRELQGLRPAW